MFVYVGAYTEPPLGSADGIAVFRFDAGTGALHPVETVPGVVNPSWLTFDRREQILFAVNEETEGRVSAFTRDAVTGTLRPLNDQLSHGADPCYVSLDPSGRYVLVANYSGGTIAVLPVAAGGQLEAATCVIHHQGSSIRPEQEGPHPHMIRPSGDGPFVLVTDLGIDQVLVYQLDPSTGQLAPNERGTAVVSDQSGAGPRHFAFAPNGHTVYVINELNSTLTVYDYTPERGELHPRQVVSTLPAGVDGPAIGNSCAHIAVSPDGRFVYGSNRGHDSIAIWEVEDANGTLRSVGHESTQGRSPRNFSLDPTGAWLLVANQESDTIVPFRRDPGTGRLTDSGPVTETPSPVVVLFSSD